jgi:hypothetical protein
MVQMEKDAEGETTENWGLNNYLFFNAWCET